MTYQTNTTQAPQAPTRHRAPSTNAFAVAAFVCAFLFWPLSILCGHIALYQIKRDGDHGLWWAITGLVISYVAMLLFIIYMIF